MEIKFSKSELTKQHGNVDVTFQYQVADLSQEDTSALTKILADVLLPQDKNQGDIENENN